jgi:hypothetical protein
VKAYVPTLIDSPRGALADIFNQAEELEMLKKVQKAAAKKELVMEKTPAVDPVVEVEEPDIDALILYEVIEQSIIATTSTAYYIIEPKSQGTIDHAKKVCATHINLKAATATSKLGQRKRREIRKQTRFTQIWV